MKTTIVTVTGSETEIPATIPAKYVRIKENAAIPLTSFIVNLKQSDHSYAADANYGPGEVIRAFGYSGIIARPPGYSAYLLPATGEALMKIRTAGGTTVDVVVEEYENLPLGQD